jgi:hypothetical protein
MKHSSEPGSRRISDLIFGSSNGKKFDYAGAVACCDIVGGDLYPLNRYGDGARIRDLGTALDSLKAISGGKRVIAAIETSNQLLVKQGWPAAGARGPTLNEWMAEVMLVRSNGCEFFYFPDVIGLNWEAFDGTPTDIADAMPGVAQAITPAPATTRAELTVTVSAPGYAEQRVTLRPPARPN